MNIIEIIFATSETTKPILYDDDPRSQDWLFNKQTTSLQDCFHRVGVIPKTKLFMVPLGSRVSVLGLKEALIEETSNMKTNKSRHSCLKHSKTTELDETKTRPGTEHRAPKSKISKLQMDLNKTQSIIQEKLQFHISDLAIGKDENLGQLGQRAKTPALNGRYSSNMNIFEPSMQKEDRSFLLESYQG